MNAPSHWSWPGVALVFYAGPGLQVSALSHQSLDQRPEPWKVELGTYKKPSARDRQIRQRSSHRVGLRAV